MLTKHLLVLVEEEEDLVQELEVSLAELIRICSQADMVVVVVLHLLHPVVGVVVLVLRKLTKFCFQFLSLFLECKMN
jgi:hypothetical protein